MDKYLLDIAGDRKYWNNKRLSIKEKEQKLDKLLSSYEENSGNLRQQRAAILREAREEAKEILSTANAKIERAILEIRQSEAEKERTKSIRRELEEYKKTVSSDNRNDENVPKILKPLRHKSRTNDASVTKPKRREKRNPSRRLREDGRWRCGRKGAFNLRKKGRSRFRFTQDIRLH